MICIHCGKEFSSNPRVKNQRYCGDRKCQTARRVRWYRGKMATDPDYRDNQKRCQKEWLDNHPGYYRKYRQEHPEYAERNRLLQLKRNAKRRSDSVSRLIAKIDALNTGIYSRKGELFRIIPQDGRLIAKIDALIARLVPVKGS
ncbi:hypothetical protein IPdc08_00075 [archaeon]|nr:hypothetical protein IPdc08_00075 [archaeon]